MEKPIRSEFDVHILSPAGITKACDIASGFSILLNDLEAICGKDGREMAIEKHEADNAKMAASTVEA